jgi:hypothetical protein
MEQQYIEKRNTKNNTFIERKQCSLVSSRGQLDAGASLHVSNVPTNQHIQSTFNRRERHQPSFQNLNFELNVCKVW